MGSGALNTTVPAQDLLKEVTITFIITTIVWQQKTTIDYQQKIGLKLLSMAPPIRTRPSLPHTQSLPSGRFYKLLSLSIRGQTEMKTTITEN